MSMVQRIYRLQPIHNGGKGGYRCCTENEVHETGRERAHVPAGTAAWIWVAGRRYVEDERRATEQAAERRTHV